MFPSPHVCVSWGELVWDRFPDGDRLGGAAANVAYHLAALGAEAHLVSRVGTDALGRRALDALARAGVNTECVQRDPDVATGQVDVTFEDGDPRYRLAADAAWDRMTFDAAVEGLLGRARVLVYGTLAQRTPLARGALRHALAIDGPLRVCDVNLRPPHVTREALDLCLEAAHVVKMNEHEAEELGRLWNTADAARYLLEHFDVRLVAITLGARGARLVTATEQVEHAGFAAGEGGDSVGAGDAFTATLSVGALEEWGMDHLARQANRYAAWVAGQPGAMPTVPSIA